MVRPIRRIPRPFPSRPSSDASSVSESSLDEANLAKGLVISVREPTAEDYVTAAVQNTSQKPTDSSSVSVQLLEEDRIETLYSRMPTIEQSEDTSEDQKEFLMRDKSLKAPKTSKEVQLPFPPKEQREIPAEVQEELDMERESELRVLRYSPEGSLNHLTATLSVTFSQPMIELSSVDNVQQEGNNPVELTPKPPGGRWRWIGTKTVLFEPTRRFNFATEYTVRIKKDTQSVNGGKLDKEVSFTFTTPPPQLTEYYPRGSHHCPDNLIGFAQFDQKIDPRQVVEYLRVNSKSCVSLLPHAEVQQRLMKESAKHKKNFSQYHTTLEYLLKTAIPNQHLFFSLDEQFALGGTVKVSFEKGTPSAEGPLTTTKPQQYSFSTYGPFQLAPRSDRKYTPYETFTVRFTNNIDQESFDLAKYVSVSPEIPFTVSVSSNYVTLEPQSKANTTYKVTFSKDIQDVYGQSLSGKNTATFTTGHAKRTMQPLQQSHFVWDRTLDVEADPTIDFVTINVKKYTLKFYHMDHTTFLKNWKDYLGSRRTIKQSGGIAQKIKSAFFSSGDKILSGLKQLKIVGTKEVLVPVQEGEEDSPIITTTPITEYLQHPKEKLGHVFVVAMPQDWPNDSCPYFLSWIQCTEMSVDAFIEGERVHCWVNSLADGSSFSNGVDLKLLSYNQALVDTVALDEKGYGRVKPPLPNVYSNHHALLAQRGNDTALLWGLRGASRASDYDKLVVFNDRGLYKPKENIHFKGIFRNVEYQDEEKAFYQLKVSQPTKFQWEVFDSRSASYAKGECTSNEHGCFDFSIGEIPDSVNLGKHRVLFKYSNNKTYHHYFDVQEFRTPEYSVSTSVAPNNYLVNGRAIAKVHADYYSGGGLSGASAAWRVTQTNAWYQPPGYSEYSFSSTVPYWWFYSSSNSSSTAVETLEGRTDSSGEHALCIQFNESQRSDKVPVRVTAECHVQDINRQTISSSSSFLVHPSNFYVGIQCKKTFVLAGSSMYVGAVVCDIDGNIEKNVPIKFTIEKKVRVRKGTVFVEKSLIVLQEYRTFEGESQEFEFKMKDGGSYMIHAEVEDSAGRSNKTTSYFAVSGDTDRALKKSSGVTMDTVTLIANQKTYKPGENAKILVQSPYMEESEGLMYVMCAGVMHTEHFKTDEHGCKVLSVAIEEKHVPNCFVDVYIAGRDTRTDSDGKPVTKDANGRPIPKRPAHASGRITLTVPPYTKTLNVEIQQESKSVEPGSSVPVGLKVTDHQGEPVSNAECCLVVADEAVLSLTGYDIVNPLTFITDYNSHLRRNSLRSNVSIKEMKKLHFEKKEEESLRLNSFGGAHLERGMPMMQCMAAAPMKRNRIMKKNAKMRRPPVVEEENFNTMLMMDEEDDASDNSSDGSEGENHDGEAITLRTDFRPLAAFLPNLITNEQGEVTATINLPQNLTRFRITAIVVEGNDHFGKAQSTVSTQLPLSLRPSLPRFLNFGDCNVDFSVVLHNQSSRTLEVETAVRMTNLELEKKNRGYLIRLTAGQRSEIRFPVRAVGCGTARFQIGAGVRGSSFSDAVNSAVPVYAPATSEAFATYGELDESVAAICQPVRPPSNIFPQFGGFEISTSSTAIASLTDCFLYLYSYQFACSEQTASRILSILAVAKILEAFKVKGMPSRREIQTNLNSAFKKLRDVQKDNGAYGFWSQSEISVYASIHVAHALVRAKNDCTEGLIDSTLEKSVKFLKRVNQYVSSWYSNYSMATRLSLRSYAVYVLSLMKEKMYGVSNASISEEAKSIYAAGHGVSEKSILSAESLAWLCFAMYVGDGSRGKQVDEILKWFSNRVNETAETANIITSFSDRGEEKMLLLHSNVRTDAVVLDMLMTVDASNTLIPKFVKGLQAHKKKGRWSNTQENIFVLLALRKYFRLYESETPDFTARVWMGERFCGEASFKGRTTETQEMMIPMSEVVDGGVREESEEAPHENETPQDEAPQTKKNLILSKEGLGRLYYRLGLTYAPRNLKLDAASFGFSVSRTYEGVTLKNHVQKKSDGTWVFAAGELVRVRLTLSNQSRRYHVALVDKLPAGLEVLNPDLNGSGSFAGTSGGGSNRGWMWWRQWFEHQNLRTERVEAFTSLLYPGAHEYSYTCRATSLGEFVIPPCHAEEMYSPELFGRSSSEKVLVKYMTEGVDY